ncbi:hypothetical protein NMG60_11021350 [Bertholletia excelsa]
MALRIHPIHPQILARPLKLPATVHFPSATLTHLCTTPKPQILCSKGTRASELASELASEVEKMAQREEALKKSLELLFTELCKHQGLRTEELRRKWKKMGEEERWVLIKGFVLDWGLNLNFHPLSARSVKEMVEEYLGGDDSRDRSSSVLFPGLKKIIWFSANK